MSFRPMLPWWMYVITTIVVYACVESAKWFLHWYDVELTPDMLIVFCAVIGALSAGACAFIYGVFKIMYDDYKQGTPS